MPPQARLACRRSGSGLIARFISAPQPDGQTCTWEKVGAVGVNQQFAVFSSWSSVVQGALYTSKEFRPCLCHQRAQLCPAGTAPRVWGWKPRCHGEMLAVKVLANQHWFAHNRLSCIGGSVGDYLPKGNSSKTQASWKDVLLLWHAKSHSSTARHLSPQSCSATAFEEGEARHSIHGCGLNTRMVRCRRLTQCSDRKKRHVRHVHSRLNLARQFATLRACFQKEFFIDEKVRFNKVQKQGSCVQIISGVQYKPDQARHKWNQLNVVTDALLDVALSASSTFMLPMPLIEEGVATCASPWQTLAEFFLCKSLEKHLFVRGRAFLEVLGQLVPDELHSCCSSSFQPDMGCLMCMMQRGALQTV